MMLRYPGGFWIVARWYGARVAEPTVPALNADFVLTQIVDDLVGPDGAARSLPGPYSPLASVNYFGGFGRSPQGRGLTKPALDLKFGGGP